MNYTECAENSSKSFRNQIILREINIIKKLIPKRCWTIIDIIDIVVDFNNFIKLNCSSQSYNFVITNIVQFSRQFKWYFQIKKKQI